MITLTDPIFTPESRLNPLDRFARRFINDVRDLPFIHLILKISLTIVPFAIYLFIPGQFSWWLAAPYWGLTLLYFLGPMILMMHNTSHRRFFKKEYNFLNYLIPWGIAPFFGETPETYRAHHIFMHHVEGNLPPDLSSTMPYQRDKFFDFVRYFCRFFFMGLLELTRYFSGEKRRQIRHRLLKGEFSYYIVGAGLITWNWKASLVVLIVPFIVSRFAMMAGNWAQHAFIDLSSPDNSFRNSITCINSTYNRRCFNDGYHIGHHLRASNHWTDMPSDFLKNRDLYLQEKAIIFQKVDYFFIWLCLMLKKFSWLAKHYVDLDEITPKSKDEIIALLRSRVQKIA